MFLGLIRMSSRYVDTDILQVRNIFARSPTNNFIPSSHILIANGDGSTRWGPASSIIEISSFNRVKGNNPAVSLDGNLVFNTLQVSTVGVANTFQSYVDPVANVLMLSNIPPPFAVTQGSIPIVTSNAAITQPNVRFLQQQPGEGVSSIKFFGVNDIQLSTFTGAGAMFISISSFTSAGYSTISGETFNWRPTLYSTLSTSAGTASFVSSISFTSYTGLSNLVSVAGNTDFYFSSLTFPANHLMKYMDNHNNNTRMFVELYPNFIFPYYYRGDGQSALVPPIKEIVSYLQIQAPNTPSIPTTPIIFNESSNVSQIISQNVGDVLSNYFTTPIRMPINPYTIQSNIDSFLPGQVSVAVMHKIVAGRYAAAAGPITGNIGFYPNNDGITAPMLNLTNVKGGLYVHLTNNIATLP
jgi:hypothetical protein